MAKAPKKKLTKSEAGRLGGKATVRKYGTEHMRTIGKAGFQGLRRKFGWTGGSGRGALRWLIRKGIFPGETPAEFARSQADYERLFGLAPPEEDPLIAGILASIHAAPVPAWGGL